MLLAMNIGIHALALSGATPLPENEAEKGFWQAIAEGEAHLRFRYRAESVDSDASVDEAFASTLRTTLSYRTGEYEGFRGFAEFEDVSPVGDDSYNSTVNGNTTRPVVADPASTEVNQLYLNYVGTDDMDAILGRQEVVLDNSRFVGNVAWRQNFQSFDAVRVIYTGLEKTKVDYIYMGAVNRIFGDDSPAGDEDMNSHLVNLSREIGEDGKLTVYGYRLRFDDSMALSTATFGARYTGKANIGDDTTLHYTGEFASQSDTGNNPVEVDADYLLAEIGADISGVRVTAGMEQLSGSGAVGDKFTTPLATAHKFNGFADLFLATPDTGLDDTYLTLQGKIGDAKCRATYHDFSSDSGGIDYGSEIDFDLILPVDDHVSFGFKFAQFDMEDSFADTTKLMAWVNLTP